MVQDTEDEWLGESSDLSVVQPYNQVPSHGGNMGAGWDSGSSPEPAGPWQMQARRQGNPWHSSAAPITPGTLVEGGCDPAAERPVGH